MHNGRDANKEDRLGKTSVIVSASPAFDICPAWAAFSKKIQATQCKIEVAEKELKAITDPREAPADSMLGKCYKFSKERGADNKLFFRDLESREYVFKVAMNICCKEVPEVVLLEAKKGCLSAILMGLYNLASDFENTLKTLEEFTNLQKQLARKLGERLQFFSGRALVEHSHFGGKKLRSSNGIEELEKIVFCKSRLQAMISDTYATTWKHWGSILKFSSDYQPTCSNRQKIPDLIRPIIYLEPFPNFTPVHTVPFVYDGLAYMAQMLWKFKKRTEKLRQIIKLREEQLKEMKKALNEQRAKKDMIVVEEGEGGNTPRKGEAGKGESFKTDEDGFEIIDLPNPQS